MTNKRSNELNSPPRQLRTQLRGLPFKIAPEIAQFWIASSAVLVWIDVGTSAKTSVLSYAGVAAAAALALGAGMARCLRSAS